MAHRNLSSGQPQERSVWREVATDVYAASLFDGSECESMLQAIETQRESAACAAESPNSMQRYGTVVRDPALSKGIADMLRERLRHPIRELFQFLPHSELSEHHAFLTVYGCEGNQDLSLHVDASHITLNICLHNTAKGSNLVFTGRRCLQHLDDVAERPAIAFRFRRGDALLHVGNQRHFVTSIESGQRKNLVVWSRLEKTAFDHSNQWVKERCPACNRQADSQ